MQKHKKVQVPRIMTWLNSVFSHLLKCLHGPSFRDLLREEAARPGSSPPSQKALFPTMRTSCVEPVLSSSVSEEHILGGMGFSGETVS